MVILSQIVSTIQIVNKLYISIAKQVNVVVGEKKNKHNLKIENNHFIRYYAASAISI